MEQLIEFSTDLINENRLKQISTNEKQKDEFKVVMKLLWEIKQTEKLKDLNGDLGDMSKVLRENAQDEFDEH